MRVLYTNYSSAHTVLKAVLLKLGHKYEVVGNGTAVLEGLQRPAGPRFAIFDSNLPGVSGFDICRRLKDAPPDPRLYTIVMTPENDRTQVLTALEAGADDYLQKPFDSTELIARLQIAERILTQREEFQKQLTTAQDAAPANDAQPDAGAPNAEDPNSPSAVLSFKEEPRRQRKLFTDAFSSLNSLPAFSAFEQLVIKTLSGMGLGDASPLDSAAVSHAPDFSIHSVTVLPDNSAWLDLILDLDRYSAEALYAAMTGATAYARDELLDMAGEVMNILQGAIKGALSDGSHQVFTPLLPIKVSRDKRDAIHLLSSECTQVSFSLGNITLSLSLVPHFAPVVTKSIDDVRVRDVVVDPVKLPGNAKLNLIEKGTLLLNHHLSRLREIAGYGMTRLRFETVSPSELSVLVIKV